MDKKAISISSQRIRTLLSSFLAEKFAGLSSLYDITHGDM